MLIIKKLTWFLVIGFILNQVGVARAQSNSTNVPILIDVGITTNPYVSYLVIDDQSLGHSSYLYAWHYLNTNASDGTNPLTGDDLMNAVVEGTSNTPYALTPLYDTDYGSFITGFQVGSQVSRIETLEDPAATSYWAYWISGGSQTASYYPYTTINPTNWMIAPDIAGYRLLTNGSFDGYTLSPFDQYGNYTGSAPLENIPVSVPLGTNKQTLTFPPVGAEPFGTNWFQLRATASSGLRVTYGVSGPAKALGDYVQFTGAGKVTIVAYQSGSSKYAAAKPLTNAVTIPKAFQSITFPAISGTNYGSAPLILRARASSGLPVSYSVTGNASLRGSNLAISGAGTITVVAKQLGNTNYLAAMPVTNSVLISRQSQTLSPFLPIPSLTYSNGISLLITNIPKASSGLTTTLSVLSGPARMNGSTLIISSAGLITLAANQSGNANFYPAAQISNTVTVMKADQTIFPFTGIPKSKTYTTNAAGSTFTITLPHASSGLPVVINVSGAATNNGSAIRLIGVGEAVVTARQAGNINYNPASDLSTNFTVLAK
jgi:hypothetical protein